MKLASLVLAGTLSACTAQEYHQDFSSRNTPQAPTMRAVKDTSTSPIITRDYFCIDKKCKYIGGEFTNGAYRPPIFLTKINYSSPDFGPFRVSLNLLDLRTIPTPSQPISGPVIMHVPPLLNDSSIKWDFSNYIGRDIILSIQGSKRVLSRNWHIVR